MRRESGTTLIEVLIAVTLLSLLSVGMLTAMRVGFMAYSKTTNKLMENRRVAGAQRVVQEELEGMMPVVAACGEAPGATPAKTAFFEGQAQTIRLVSTFSLQQGWRGQPQILELFTIPGEDGRGVRLAVGHGRTVPVEAEHGELALESLLDVVTAGHAGTILPHRPASCTAG